MDNEAPDVPVDVTLSAEMAESACLEWLEVWEIDTDFSGLKDEARESSEQMLAKVKAEFQAGRLTYDATGLHFRLREPIGDYSILTFREPKAGVLLNMDKHKDREQIHKVYEVIAGMTRVPPAIISKLNFRDVQTAMNIAALFLA